MKRNTKRSTPRLTTVTVAGVALQLLVFSCTLVRAQPESSVRMSPEDILAMWRFESGAEAKDGSGNGHDLVLRGQARWVAGGQPGGCLESFAASPRIEQPQGAQVKSDPRLSPQGAFTLELSIRLKPEAGESDTLFLLDKKYYHYARPLPQANWDYCLYLRRTAVHQYRVVACLGYGTDSADYVSREVTIEPSAWHRVAFSYDGVGNGRFYLDGQSVGRVAQRGRGSIAPGTHPLVLGDRVGSNYVGFPGFMDEVRILKGVPAWLRGTLEIDLSAGRRAFLRMEKNARVVLRIVNDTRKSLAKGTVDVSLAGRSQRYEFSPLAENSAKDVEVPIDTSLRPDRYLLKVAAAATSGEQVYRAEKDVAVTIAPRPRPHRMPVVMWGSGDFETLKSIGFTHQLVNLVDYAKVWAAGQSPEGREPGNVAELADSLDQHTAEDLGAVVQLSPGRWVMDSDERKARFGRVNRSGQHYEKDENVCALFPEVQSFGFNTGASVARTFGQFPSLQAALIHTEIRDHTNLCFHEHDLAAFRKLTGLEIPSTAASKYGVRYADLKDFPANRIVPDDHPLLTFYRWFWKEGDGWNSLHTRVHEGLKSTGRSDLWTFFDPAVRAPSVWGSGGGVDVLSQWTYSYPDPIKIGQATDELLAMAEGATARQRVMKMTQIIWYRTQTAPKPTEGQNHFAPWEKEIPDAAFITIAPDHLREALWSKISRPIQGIMYHGWGSLVSAKHGSYRFTNPETRVVLTQLIRDVVEPLGPTLLQVPDRKSEVGVLESLASQVFAGRGTSGWSGRWEADLHLALQWAQLQPRILFDETILRDGLADLRVLVLPNCDVLTERVAKRIVEFQSRGGLIVADENVTPAIKPDIVVKSFQRNRDKGRADEEKAALQERARYLRNALDPLYQRYGDSSNPDVVIRFRQYEKADYVFVVNDKRTFGDYVGHHGKVMEKGLSASAKLSVRRASGHVYDLVRHVAVPASASPGAMEFEAQLGPGEGRVFLISEQAIAAVRIAAPDSAAIAKSFPVRVEVVDAAGQPVSAVIPLQIEILDSAGHLVEFSGYYGAKDGQVSLAVDVARNDPPGRWTVRARELASGRVSEKRFNVE